MCSIYFMVDLITGTVVLLLFLLNTNYFQLKKLITYSFSIAFLILATKFIYWVHDNRFELKELFYPTTYINYSEFGIRIPTKYKTHGIDVSHHNGHINWKLVSQMKVDSIHVDFAFIKSTEGLTFKDKKFGYNWKNSKKNGVIRGAYHYFHPDKSGIEQAKHFAKVADLKKGDFAPVIDLEEDKGQSKATIIKESKAFMNYLEKQYGVKPILYTYHSFYQKYLVGEFDNYPLWLAHYHISNPKNNVWNFWQHSDRGNVNGIKGKVDFNVFNRDASKLKNYTLK